MRPLEIRRHTSLAVAVATLSALSMLADPGRPSWAQTERPRSPQGSSAAQIGGNFDPVSGFVNGRWIDIHHGRPLKRGRDIFGPDDFVEFLNDGAEVWRAGANHTTRLRTDLALTIAGARVEPGEYTMFIELGHDEWSFILSTWPAQTRYDHENRDALFGAYDYTPDRDVVRAPMKLEELGFAMEQLSWQIVDLDETGGRLALLWDRTMASVEFALADEAD